MAGDGVTLTRLGAAEAARAVRRREIGARELLEAYLERIAVVQPVLNAICEPLYAQAREAAVAVDTALARGEDPGPLAGVPTTIKEQFLVRGTTTALGLLRERHHRASEDGPSIRALRRAGAVIVAKTNVPQLLYSWETDNPIHGRTCNPWAGNRVPGGSSGGEAALLAAGGTALGLGGDFGGSIRIPAHFCGVCGLRPTPRRLTVLDTRGDLFAGSQELMLPTVGPMARRVEDIDLAMGALSTASAELLDDAPAPLPWRGVAGERLEGLRVGLVEDDGVFSPSPSLRRAVREAASALRDRGVQAEPFVIPDAREAFGIVLAILTADGAASVRRSLGREPPTAFVRSMLQGAAMSGPMAAALAPIMDLLGQGLVAFVMRASRPCGTEELWQRAWRLHRWQSRCFDAMRKARLDALLCAPFGLPAFEHGRCAELLFAGSYAFLPGALGCPSGVVPVTRVRQGEESDRRASADRWMQAAERAEQGSAGLPVGVQVVGRPWHDEQVVAIMAAVEQAARAAPDFPLTPIDPGCLRPPPS